MAIDPFIEPPDPGREGPGGPGDDGHDDAILEAQASAALERWLQDHPRVATEITATARAEIHLEELAGRTHEAEQAQQDAEQRDDVMLTRQDPAGHRILGFAAGAALVVLLVVL